MGSIRVQQGQATGAATSTAVIETIADIAPEEVRWLWPSRIAFGKLTAIAGDPGVGKSYLPLDVAARASRGVPMPGEEVAVPPIDVLLLSAEDGAADTIRPRLDALGGD